MTSIASHTAFFVSGIVLLALGLFLKTHQPNACTAAIASRATLRSSVCANESAPTLAPPLKVVYVQVETDEAGIEVGWAD